MKPFTWPVKAAPRSELATVYQRLDQFLDYHARVHSGLTFVSEETTTLTFAQVQERVDRIAGQLAVTGLVKGDRIALLGKNSGNFLMMYLASSRLGIVPVAINYRLTPAESSFIIANSGARLLFADAEFIDPIIDYVSDYVSDHLSNVTVISLFGQHPHLADLDQWLGQESQPYSKAEVSGDDVLAQMYTSGTTGLPKGVLLTHNNVIANERQTAMGSEYTFSPGQEFLLVAPMYHAAGIMTAYTGLVQGLSLVIHRDYVPERVVQTLAERPIAAVTLVPAMLKFIIDNIPGLETKTFPALELVYYGAAPIPVPLLQRAIEIFGCDFTQGYGQTEANSIITMLSASDHRRALQSNPELLKTVGRAAFNTEIQLLDQDGKQSQAGESGEIVVRGPQVMLGYWNDPEATANTLRGGWLHTGDVGVFDDQGYLSIVGRVKDMIISGGENVYPVEIENVLTAHADINDAAVIGVANERWGEVPLAIVVSDNCEQPTTEELSAHCRRQLAAFKVPAHFLYMDALPRNPSGKVLKQQLREDIGKNYD